MKNKWFLLLLLMAFQWSVYANDIVELNLPSATETHNVCKKKSLRVLQFNTWNQGRVVSGGEEGIERTLEEVDPDVVLFQEIRGQAVLDRFSEYFKKKGITYYGYSLNLSSAFFSKYPVKSIRNSDELGKDSYAFVKAIVEIENMEFAFYSVHLDWLHISYYNVRGRDCNSPVYPLVECEPLTDPEKVLAENAVSRRPTEIKALIADAKKEIEKGRIVIVGGDFNEPSFLDWQKNTKDIRDHNGVVVNWPCSYLLDKAGFKDCFRKIYPDPVKYPGFTCNAGNKWVDKNQLFWTSGVDERERIDLNFYYPHKNIKLKDVHVVGPREDFYDGKIQPCTSKDKIYTPDCVWASDHKAVLSEYELKVPRSKKK